MNEDGREKFFDLATKKAVYGLEGNELREFDEMEMSVDETLSMEMTVAAISLVGLTEVEPMPAHLHERILEDAAFVWEGEAAAPSASPERAADQVAAVEPARSHGWLGWLAAAAACLALGVNIYLTRFQPSPESVRETPPPVQQPVVKTPAELRADMLASSVQMVKANWAPGNVKEIADISGDIVWSDEKQLGYMRFRGLPIKTAPDHCYQLWIFDKTQDPKKPIDGGTFDVNSEGEIIIPIDAKLKAEGAYQFALTIERHGGVVVSDGKRIAALAKVG